MNPVPGGGPSNEVQKGEGFIVTPPPGWEARITSAESAAGPAVQLATFPLTSSKSDMQGNDAYALLSDLSILCPCPSAQTLSAPPQINDSDLAAPLEGVPDFLRETDSISPDHGLVRRVFEVGDRYFLLHVEFGSLNVPSDLLAETNIALDAIAIDKGYTPEVDLACPVQGPWSDPDCPQSSWVREVLARADYRIVDVTGSALVAAAGGVEFYIWATLADGDGGGAPSLIDAVKRGRFRLFDEVAGIKVYTDGKQLAWEIHGLEVWVRDTYGNASSIREIDLFSPVIEASQRVAYPLA